MTSWCRLRPVNFFDVLRGAVPWSPAAAEGGRWPGGGCTKMRLASLRSEPVQRRNLRGSSPRSLSSHKQWPHILRGTAEDASG
jgi:hypothetical protein